MGKSFAKFYRTAVVRKLIAEQPTAYLLLSLIVQLADYRNGKALIGDRRAIGKKTTEQQYRTAKEVLERMGLVSFKGIPRKGTVATIISDKIFSIKDNNGISNGNDNGNDNGNSNGLFEAENPESNGINNGNDNGTNHELLASIQNNSSRSTPPIIPPQGEAGKPPVGFVEFWEAYPRRNGRKLGKAKAQKVFDKFKEPDKQKIIVAAKNYAASGQMPKDPERFLKNDYWNDWITPAENNQSPAQSRFGGKWGNQQ